ncbi:MAG: hypothetical protein KDC06_12220, partial [Chitinophagaceae bacterium]|nr:hypothetical protein [Chitinophagaceae bacterium]
EGGTTYSGSVTSTDYQVILGTAGFTLSGTNTSDLFSIIMLDPSGAITTGQTYSSAASRSGWTYNLPGGDIWSANTGQANTDINFTNVTHDVANKTITADFSGTVRDNNGAGNVHTITEGNFSATYQ